MSCKDYKIVFNSRNNDFINRPVPSDRLVDILRNNTSDEIEKGMIRMPSMDIFMNEVMTDLMIVKHDPEIVYKYLRGLDDEILKRIIINFLI